MSAQFIHCVVTPKSGLPSFFCTFIYAYNEAKDREVLWRDLRSIRQKMDGPWLLMGDLNCVMNTDERFGSQVRAHEILDIRSCMEDCGMQDIPYGGHFFTWSNKQNGEDRVFSKLDRVMANEGWMEAYGGANALFLSEGVSDHCPAIMQVDKSTGKGKKPFKYYRMWSQAADFKDRVKQAWQGTTKGTPMFKLTQQLKKVKVSMKRLNQEGFCSMQADETWAYQHLLKIQEQLHKDPTNVQLTEEERRATTEYQQKHNIYMQFLKQKAKCSWI
ncbi:Phosphoadenosine phosphosulfate reductase [Bienertia sinuspersici]